MITVQGRFCFLRRKKLPKISPKDYVAGIKENPIAKTVKLADLRHNSDLSRLDSIDEKALERIEKYRQAIALLENCEP